MNGNFRNFLKTISAMLELRATEMRTGITLAEAVAADATRAELLEVVGSQHEVQKALDMSVDLAKLGINDPDLLQSMIAYYYRGTALGIEFDDFMKIAAERIDKRRSE